MRSSIIACAMGFMLSVSTWGQQVVEGDLSFLRNVHAMQLVLDFSNASMLGLSEDKFAVYEKDWQKEKKEIYGELLSEISKRNKHIAFTRQEKPYVLKVEIKEVSLSGNTICNLIFYSDSKEMAVVEGIYGKGGKYGTKINLIGDGVKSIGKKTGDFIRKAKRR